MPSVAQRDRGKPSVASLQLRESKVGPQQKSRESGILSLNGLGEKFIPSVAQRNRGKPSVASLKQRESKVEPRKNPD